MRKHWADFLREKKINYCFFSALFEQKKIEDETPLNQDILTQLKENDKNIEEEVDDEEEDDGDNNYNMFKNLKAGGKENEEQIEEVEEDNVDEEDEEQDAVEEEQEETNEFNEKNNNNIKEENTQENKTVQSEEKLSTNEKEKIEENKDKQLVPEIKIENKTNYINNDETIRILNRDELILLFKEKLSKKQKSVQNSLYHIVGFVGYPNVGKSSVINLLMKAKRVNLMN